MAIEIFLRTARRRTDGRARVFSRTGWLPPVRHAVKGIATPRAPCLSLALGPVDNWGTVTADQFGGWGVTNPGPLTANGGVLNPVLPRCEVVVLRHG